MTVVWTIPTRIVFGVGTVGQVGLEAMRHGGKHPLVVVDAGVKEAGLLETVTQALETAQIAWTVFDQVTSHPDEAIVLAATTAYRDSGCDCVVAVGGGSVIDVGKLVRLTVTLGPPLDRFAVGGSTTIAETMPPMIAVPTTAGSGSEVAQGAVLADRATGASRVIASTKLVPTVALIDPQLTTTLSPRLTATTGIQALTHCIEAYCAQGDHPMADAIAMAGAELVARNIERAVNEGKDVEVRGLLMKAAMMGGVAMRKGQGACHAMAHPLAIGADLHTGIADGICLPAVLDFNRSAVQDRIARVGKLIGARGDDEETLAFECAGAVRALRRKVGLPEGLAAVAVDEELIHDLVPLAMEDPEHRRNPRACSAEDMFSLYRASL